MPSAPINLTRPDGYTLSTDPARLDLDLISHYLGEIAYWCKGRSPETVVRSIENSLCIGVYAPNGQQAGFARLVTDYATFAWLCDVFVLDEYKSHGLGKWMVEAVVAHADMAGLRILLATRDAHELYRRYGGFVNLLTPERWMERPRKTT